MGLFGYAIPQEWGGLGLNLAQDVELAMELGYTSLALRSMFGTNNGIAGQVLVGFGTDEQKAHMAGAMATGEVVASFALTEPGAGSNPSGLRTKAVRDGDDWIINGDKRFITNAPIADLFVVFARTRPADDDGPGIAVFLVPADTAGVQVGAKDAKMGQEGAWTADVSFTDVRVPATALIGGSEDIGYRAAMTSLARGRVHIAALAVGIAQRALDESVAYAATATQGGTPIGNFQLVQAMLADQQTGVLAGRALVRDTARLWVTGEDRRIAPSAAKLFCTEMAGKVADLAVQVHGGSGYMREVPVERIYRDVRLLRLYEGTSEIQRLIIGGNLVKAAQRVKLQRARSPSSPGRRGGRAARTPSGWPRRAPTSSPSISPATAALRPVHLCDPGGSGRNGASRRSHGASHPRLRRRHARPRRMRKAVDDGVAEFGRLDIIVANAGISAPAAWNAITPEAFRDVMDINVTGTWNTVMAGAQKIIDGGRGGSIVLIGSAAGIKLQPFMIHYTASKHAVTGMARAFAAELGKHSIRVNSVHPGPVVTPMGSDDMVAAVAKAAEADGNQALMNMLTPFLPNWVAQPEDIADAVCWLAGDESKFVTAQAISVDQGSTQY